MYGSAALCETMETMLFGTCKRLKKAGEEFELLYNNVKISFTETTSTLGTSLTQT